MSEGKEGSSVQRRLKALYEQRKQGISMVLVLCVSAFFIAFAVAILYTAGLLTAQAGERLLQERCYQLAAGYAGVLDGELKAYSIPKDTTDTFYGFVNQFLDGTGYAEYDPSRPEDTIFYYQPIEGDSDGTDYGKIRIGLYKESSEDDNTSILTGTVIPGTADNYQLEIDRINSQTLNRYILTVQVRVQEDDESYTYSTEYYRMETYKAEFYHNGTSLIWSEDKWHEGTSEGPEHNMDLVTTENPITYKLNTNIVTSLKYENVYQEADRS